MARFDYILHRANGTLVELNSQVGTFRAVTSERLTAVRQDVSSAELTLISSEAFTVNVGDWIQAKGMRLYCMSTIDKYTCSEDNNREYQLTFYSPEYYLRQAIFYNTSESESGGAYSYSRVDNTYPSVGTFEDFVKLCCYNCNSVQGVRMFKVGTINEDIATDIRVITFSDYNCLAVMKQSCESFETTWKVRVNEDPEPDSVFIIDFGAAIDDFPVTLKVEHAQGLASIDVTASDKDVYTQFVIKGGSENLPSDYPYPNLQLDEDLESTPPILANSMIKLSDLYSRWGKSIKELTYEDIKPSRTGTVTSTSENILKFTDSDLIGADWSPVGGTVHFVSGHLIGFTFNCQDFNSATGEITIESTEESNGFVLPSTTDSYYRINELDKYNIAGVSLPSSYITAAKTALKERALLGIDYWSQPRMQYAITIDPKIISVEIVPNMGFHIEHPALGIDKVIKVQQVIYDLSKESPYDIESILISDLKTDDSRADSTHRQIATTIHRLEDTKKVTTSIQNSVKNLDTYIDGAFADGLVSEAEAKAIEKYINIVNSQKSDIDAQFTALYANSYLSGTAKTNLNSAKEALNTSVSNLLDSIATAITDGAATTAEKADVDSKFTAFNSALSTYQTRVEEAKAAIEAAIETAANNYTNQLESDLEYLKNGFRDGSTYVTGGLVLSEFVGVTDGATPTPNVVAGMAGKDFVLDGETPITSPMFFAGATSAQNANNAKYRVYQDGSMYAELGKIGGLTIAASKLYLGTGNHNNADTAFYVDDDGKFSLKNKLSFDGTDLTINGGGTFTGSVSIGDILIGKDAYGSGLHGIKLNTYNYWYLDGANAKVKFGGETNYISWDGTTLTQNGAAIGGGSIVGTSIDIPNATTPLFKVTAAGVITAKSGTIGGLKIAATKTYLGDGNYGNSDTGFYVDTSAKFSLKDKLKFDGTNLTINGGGTFSGALSAATGSFSGSLSAAGGTFSGLLDVDGIKIGLNAISAGVDGLYINTNNYWDESGNFKAGSTGSYIHWNGTTFAIKGDITGSTGTFGGVFAGTITVGEILKMGADAGGTGDFGIYIDSANYWLESGFSVGVGTSLLYLDGSTMKYSGELLAASGTFTGTVNIGASMKIGEDVESANDGIFINTNNYWYSTGKLMVGDASAYLSYNAGALSMVGGSFSTTDGTTSVNISPSAVSGAGIKVSKGDAFAQIGLSGSWPSVFVREGGTGTPSALLTPGQVTVGDTAYATLTKTQLSLSGLVFNTTNLGTGNVVKTANGGFLRFGTSVDNEDASHKHNKISGYTVVIGTGSDPDTIYLSTA